MKKAKIIWLEGEAMVAESVMNISMKAAENK
jgi:hypothetical protein